MKMILSANTITPCRASVIERIKKFWLTPSLKPILKYTMVFTTPFIMDYKRVVNINRCGTQE